ncbi:putative transcription factor C2H2 family [Dioscorea sansibarensis]
MESSRASTSSFLVLCICRICHEEEDEKDTKMESPCACSGTLKFAHRGCIQRWCEEKGSTVCEICLQKFEPGYSAPPKKALVDVPVTIRDSLEVQRHYEARPEDEDEDDHYFNPACYAATERIFSYCRAMALMFTVFLLYKHLVVVLSAGEDHHYAFPLLTVFILRAVGIVLPFYLIMRMVSSIQQWQWQQHLEEQQQIHGTYSFTVHGRRHHIINIHR